MCCRAGEGTGGSAEEAAGGGAWGVERPGWSFHQGLLAEEEGDEDWGVEEVGAGGDDFGLGAGEGDSLKVAAVCG